MALATGKLTFVPSKSVTFMPNASKQMAELTVTNDSDKTIMFKMKSTKPGMFKMRPVYGAVGPGDKCTVKLIFKGLKTGQEAPRKERFTMVTAIAPSMSINIEKVWKMHKYQEKLAENEMTKKRFRILFFGVNDQEEDDEDEGKGSKEKEVKKGINEGDPVSEDKGVGKNEKTTPDVIVKKEVVQAPPKKLVVVMYRDQKEDSLSGEDDGDDVNNCEQVTQPKADKAEGKSDAKSAATQMSVAKKASGEKVKSTATQTKSLAKKASGEKVKSAATQPPASVAQKSNATQTKSFVPPSKAPPASKAASVLKSNAAAQENMAEMDDDLIGTKTCRQNKNFEVHAQEAGK